MRALLYRRGGLGDTLLTFPILELLKKKGYEVTAVGNTDYFSIAKHVGWADRVLSEIPEESFDLEVKISFEGNLRPFPQERVWLPRYYLEALGMGKGLFSKELPLTPLEDSSFKDSVVFHPSSGSPKKNPSLRLFRRLESYANSRGHRTTYIVGEADSWIKKEVSNYVESLSPLWIGQALASAKLFIGLDSGISHLCAYVGVPTVVIYGPTDPLTWRPIGEKVYQLSLGFECSPCFPDVCDERTCLEENSLFESLLPLLNKLLI